MPPHSLPPWTLCPLWYSKGLKKISSSEFRPPSSRPRATTAMMTTFSRQGPMTSPSAMTSTTRPLVSGSSDMTRFVSPQALPPSLRPTYLSFRNQHRHPLKPAQIYQDISQDHANKTVTIEPHPHLNMSQASIHPCKVCFLKFYLFVATFLTLLFPPLAIIALQRHEEDH